VDIRDERSTTVREWYCIENGSECQVGVRVCFMAHKIIGPSWHKGPIMGHTKSRSSLSMTSNNINIIFRLHGFD
jgi:hypothetical protein